MNCTELRDQIISHGDNTALSDADATDRGTRILEVLVAIVNDFAQSKKWRYRRRLSTLLTFSSGSVAVPSDFAELGPYGGLFDAATGGDLGEVDEKEIVLLRQRLSARTDIYAIYGQDTTTGVQKFQIPSTGSFTAYCSYLATVPTLDYTTNNDKLKVAVPPQYHQLALIPGVLWKLQRGKGDARSEEYRAEYMAAKRMAMSAEKQRRSESVQLPTFSGR